MAIRHYKGLLGEFDYNDAEFGILDIGDTEELIGISDVESRLTLLREWIPDFEANSLAKCETQARKSRDKGYYGQPWDICLVYFGDNSSKVHIPDGQRHSGRG